MSASDTLLIGCATAFLFLALFLNSVKKSRVSSRQLVSIDRVGRLVGLRITSFKTCYQKLSGEEFRVNVGSSIVSKDYSGLWICRLIDCGGWGCIYRCECSGRVFVVKIPKEFKDFIESGGRGVIKKTISIELWSELENIISNVKNLSHPHIIKLLDYSLAKIPLLIYEYANQGSLEYQVSMGWRPSVKEVVLIGIQLCDALRYIHGRGLVHGDVNPNNIFVKDGVVKLGDFSTLKMLLSLREEHMECTPGYFTPEYYSRELWIEMKERGYENRIDVYQLGNTLLYLLTRETVDGRKLGDKVFVENILSRIEYNGLRNIIRETIQYHPWNRPSSEELLKQLYNLYNSL